MGRRAQFTAVICLIASSPPITAEESAWSYSTESQEADASDVFLPAASFFIPGLGQWCRGQFSRGAIYSGVAIGGVSYAQSTTADFDVTKITSGEFSEKNVAVRKYLFGSQVYQASGGLSLYHTFRSSVWQRQKFGKYSFLGQGDSPADVLLAPFQFQFLARSSSWIPLGVMGVLAGYLASHPDQGQHISGLGREDPWFAAVFSYNAGTHEEAVFRGWAMPLFYEGGLSEGWSNLAQAALFAAAHLGSNKIPLPQFFLGLHLGNVTQRNHWTLQESIFIHVWWDVFAFLGGYYVEKDSPSSSIKIRGLAASKHRASLFLPPIDIHF